MKRNQWLIVGIGLIVVLIAGVLVMNQGDSDNANGDTVAGFVEPGIIQASAYLQQFTSPGVDHYLVDVRTPEEFASGHIEGAVNIPVDVLNQYISQLPTDQPIVVYCRSGNRSATAVDILENAGLTNVYDIQGGTNSWTSQGLPLQN